MYGRQHHTIHLARINLMCLKIPMLQGLVKIHQVKKPKNEKPKKVKQQVSEKAKSGSELSMTRKCCHSRVYHKALKAALLAGQTKADAKDLARKAGKKFYEEFDVSYCKADA